MTALGGTEVASDCESVSEKIADEILRGRVPEFFNKIGDELPLALWPVTALKRCRPSSAARCRCYPYGAGHRASDGQDDKRG